MSGGKEEEEEGFRNVGVACEILRSDNEVSDN